MSDDAAAEARSRLLSAAQHEVNTPLAIIRGWSETLADLWDELSEEERRGGMDTVRRTVDELVAFLGGVFAEARAENLRRHLRPCPTDVAALVRSVADRPGRRVEGTAAVRASTDPTGFETLLEHLLDAHAMVAPGAGPVTVAVADGPATVTVRTVGARPLPVVDPADPLNPRETSAVALRVVAVELLAEALGIRLVTRHDGAALVTTLELPAAD